MRESKKTKLTVLAALLLLSLPNCMNQPAEEDQYSKSIQIIPITAEVKALLLDISNTIRPFVKKSRDGMAAKDAPITFYDDGDFDSMLWAGLLCLSGEEDQCEMVKQSQSFEGRMWRSPHRAKNRIYVETEGPTFSRDMSLGTMAYLVKKRDGTLATAWKQYIESNHHRHPLDPTGQGLIYSSHWMCDQYPEIAWNGQSGVDRKKIADSCSMSNDGIKEFNAVWNYMFTSYDSNFLSKYEREDNQYWMIKFQATQVATDFNLHLHAVGMLLWKAMDSKNYKKYGKFYETFEKRDPNNPFFQYLSGNHFAAATLILSQLYGTIARGIIPYFSPTLGQNVLYNHTRYQWSFERQGKPNDNANAAAVTMFWEYIFLINLIVADFDSSYVSYIL